MILYHGSTKIITAPTFGFGNIRNDYGQGFYCTEQKELAFEWACADAENGFVNCYNLETEGLKQLNLNDGNYNTLNWIATLLANRSFDTPEGLPSRAKAFLLEHYLLDTDDFDIIRGYRADDSYFTFAKDFISGGLSFERLEVALKLGALGEQITLKSQKAFDALRFIEATPARSEQWHPKYQTRDAVARQSYLNLRHSDAPELETYIIDIMRNGGI